MRDEEWLVPDAFISSIFQTQTSTNAYRVRFGRFLTWEERLQLAIEARSIRNRLRLFRFRWFGRFSLAWDALRGQHDCERD